MTRELLFSRRRALLALALPVVAGDTGMHLRVQRLQSSAP